MKNKSSSCLHHWPCRLYVSKENVRFYHVQTFGEWLGVKGHCDPPEDPDNRHLRRHPGSLREDTRPDGEIDSPQPWSWCGRCSNPASWWPTCWGLLVPVRTKTRKRVKERKCTFTSNCDHQGSPQRMICLHLRPSACPPPLHLYIWSRLHLFHFSGRSISNFKSPNRLHLTSLTAPP